MAPWTPTLLQHVNLPVPKGTLHLAQEFYGSVIGFENDTVPQLQKDILLWFRIGDGPQQIHVAFENLSPDAEILSSRHPCFQLPSQEALLQLQQKIYEHKESGAKSAARSCDQPGGENSGSKGVEYPTRFFATDFAGNRLEFSAPKA
ncbi:uncharacterized protein I206_101491 [Kwoniella pini CBS 10737]|uniref:VOC domain-containing protein n=1 Tax=Kwoniella pini CBS 10737 TaxID=1296096 RepID=A0A1B9HWI4_9TREE|nr:uncharacterized protein I206_06536 [Kwoniella pini CBS 10737]OCF47633.1 hypothetical protein I206_06536 [Kwoniella pini CBS 10737]